MILGASFDTTDENKAFSDEHSFGFRLLSDVDHSVGRAYEVERPLGDEKIDYPLRIGYLIDPQGTIRRSYEVSDVAAFPGEVFDDLSALRS